MGEILVLSATAFEQGVFRECIAESMRSDIAGFEWVGGELSGKRVLLVSTGIGAVNTAHALTCALRERCVEWVLQVGIGGAYPESGLDIGDWALASEENYGDLGVRTGAGWKGAETIGIPVLEKGRVYYNHFPLDAEWVQEAATILPEARVGPFVTVQECSGSDELGMERGRRFEALCENMEGAAAAHLCACYGIPLVEVRAMSNIVEKRDRKKWDLPLAVERAQSAALKLLEHKL